jgi:hypothetical protein
MARQTVLAALLFLVSGSMALADSPQQYLIRLSLTEENVDATCPAQRTKELAAPNLVTVEGREANLLVGREVQTGDEALHDGTSLHFKLTKVDDTHVKLNGAMESSRVNDGEKDLVVRNLTSVHFQRTLELGAKTHLEVVGDHGKKQVIDLTVDKAPANTAQRVSKFQVHSRY